MTSGIESRPDGRSSTAAPLELTFVNQHYAPDVASTGQHLTDLAEFLASRGHRIRIYTARSRYLAGRLNAPSHEWRNGVEVRRLRATAFGRGTHIGRIADYASFYLRVSWRLLRDAPVDGVVFLTTPPLLSVVGRMLRTIRGQHYAIWSMDLHPEAEVAAGMLREGGVAARALAWLDRLAYRGADFVVDLGRYMKERIVGKGVPSARTATIEVWSHKEEIVPIEHALNPLRMSLGLRDKFVVMYSGNAGIAHDFEVILEAMQRLKEHPRIHFLFVGGGPRRAQIERFIADNAIGNATYLDYFERDQLRYSLPMADAHLISLRRPFIGVAVPGKLYGIMASQRPAIFVGPRRSEPGETVEEAGAGVVIDPSADEAGSSLVELLSTWAANPDQPARMGQRGRTTFLDRFDREICCAAFERELLARWGGASTPGRYPSGQRIMSAQARRAGAR